MGPFTNSSDVRRGPKCLCSSMLFPYQPSGNPGLEFNPFPDFHRNTIDFKYIFGYCTHVEDPGITRSSEHSVLPVPFLLLSFLAFSFLCFLHPPPRHPVPKPHHPFINNANSSSQFTHSMNYSISNYYLK